MTYQLIHRYEEHSPAADRVLTDVHADRIDHLFDADYHRQCAVPGFICARSMWLIVEGPCND